MVCRRYHCQYCDVSFPYSREGRKRHCTGVAHAKLASAHYRQYWTARQHYQAELAKEKCRRHASDQGCSYGQDCIYSHATAADVEQIRQRAVEEELLQEYGPLPSQVCSSGGGKALDGASLTRLLAAKKRDRLMALHNSNTSVGTPARDTINTDRVASPVKLDVLTAAPSPVLRAALPTHTLNTRLPPSLQHYDIDTMISLPLPEWG